jgi:putative peptidoglycan lipid II flippase
VTNALLVAAGILASRLAGLVRLRVFAHYFGLQSDAADAFNAAFRIPNLLQNLFGEGALSASFIPVYARLLADGDRREADRVAGAIAGLLALAVSVVVLAGVLSAPVLTSVLAPGFDGQQRALTIHLVRILFPGAGLLVLSAWCLGVLNGHRRFLLAYTAPVAWNATMIVTLLVFGAREPLTDLAAILAWGSVIGSGLQFAVQLPVVWRVAPDVRARIGTASSHVRAVLRAFLPSLGTRGVVQISAFVDTLLATLLPTGAVTGLANAQILYTLPVSLFGISVAASELPEMAGEATVQKQAQAGDRLRTRLDAGLQRIAFFVIPTAVAFVAFGDVVAAAVLQTGRFDAADADYVWGILAGSALGLLGATMARLYSSAYFALRDTRTPLRFAILRVAAGTLLGYLGALHLPAAVGVDPRWGAAGLTAASSIAAWLELALLRRGLNRRIGATGLNAPTSLILSAVALTGGGLGAIVKMFTAGWHPITAASVVFAAFGITYAAGTWLAGVPDARMLFSRIPRSS